MQINSLKRTVIVALAVIVGFSMFAFAMGKKGQTDKQSLSVYNNNSYSKGHINGQQESAKPNKLSSEERTERAFGWLNKHGPHAQAGRKNVYNIKKKKSFLEQYGPHAQRGKKRTTQFGSTW